MTIDTDRLKAVAENNGRGDSGAMKVTFDNKGGLILPPTPNHDAHADLCRWITVSFNLDRQHPIHQGRRDGLPGPRGHAVLLRVDAPEIRFEPITVLGEPRPLLTTLNAYAIPTDGAAYTFKTGHAAQVFHVVRMLCAIGAALSAEQETWGIIGDLQAIGEPIEGFTLRGTVPQRYEAAGALGRPADDYGRPVGRPRYLIDAQSGEIVVMASELQTIARRYIGATLAHGWLDARIRGIGWERVTVGCARKTGSRWPERPASAPGRLPGGDHVTTRSLSVYRAGKRSFPRA